jgi:ubiquinone/menaquinone biosynthesis C-methylase UbiE
MSLLVPRRVVTEELLDEHDAPHDEMRRSLRDLRRINSWAGGKRIYSSLLRRFFGGPIPKGTRILDIGTGTSDLLHPIVRDHGARGLGLDFKIDHLLYGRELSGSDVDRLVGDAWRLPLRDDSVDVVTSAHFFHHFTPEENRELLRESLRVARRGVVINDTRRHIAPLGFVRLISALRLVGEITRFDAPASVLRGYTIAEVRELVAPISAAKVLVVRAMPYRFGLLIWKA